MITLGGSERVYSMKFESSGQIQLETQKYLGKQTLQ